MAMDMVQNETWIPKGCTHQTEYIFTVNRVNVHVQIYFYFCL